MPANDNNNCMPTKETPIYTESQVKDIICRENCRSNEEIMKLQTQLENLQATNNSLVDAVCVLGSIAKVVRR